MSNYYNDEYKLEYHKEALAKEGTEKRNLNHRRILNNIVELASDRLNDWESSFIENLQNYLDNDFSEITGKQEKCLLKIQNKYLKDGIL